MTASAMAILNIELKDCLGYLSIGQGWIVVVFV